MKKQLLYILTVCLLATGSATAKTVIYSDNFVNETGLGVDTNYDLDLQMRGIDALSSVVTASSATIASASFNDGRAATGSITIASLTGITTAYATDRLTVSTTTSLAGSQVRLAGIPIIEGLDWYVKATQALTATEIARALNVKFAGLIVSTAPTGSAVVYSTAVVPGIAANDYTFTATVTSITALTPTFTGGVDNAYITLGGTRLTFNVDVGVGGTTAATATNLAAAMNANSTINTKVVSQAVGSVVTSTAIAVGTGGNYSLTSSTPSRITASAGGSMTGGAASAVAINDSNIAKTAHGMSTGFGVWWSTGSNVGISPLVWGTTYYIIKVDANNVKLATSKVNAVAGTPVVFTSSRTPTTTDTFTLNVPGIAGTPSYKWRVSNDGVYWVDVSSRTSGTGISQDSGTLSSYTYGGASQAWDFGTLNYRYLRFAVTAPTAGAIWIKNAIIGKKE